jgi:hypothetical protein
LLAVRDCCLTPDAQRDGRHEQLRPHTTSKASPIDLPESLATAVQGSQGDSTRTLTLAAEHAQTYRQPGEASGQHRGGGGGVHGDRRGEDEQVLNWSGLPLTSRLAIGLLEIRKGMVTGAVQPKSLFPCTGPI